MTQQNQLFVMKKEKREARIIWLHYLFMVEGKERCKSDNESEWVNDHSAVMICFSFTRDFCFLCLFHLMMIPRQSLLRLDKRLPWGDCHTYSSLPLLPVTREDVLEKRDFSIRTDPDECLYRECSGTQIEGRMRFSSDSRERKSRRNRVGWKRLR